MPEFEHTIDPAPVPPPRITTTSPWPRGVAGVSYSFTLKATGGSGSYIYVLKSPLNEGLSLNPDTGEISGTPTVSGTVTSDVDVVDAVEDPAPEPPPVPTPGAWPDNEPSGLVPVYPGHPTVPGVLVDGSDLKFDYTGAGGSNLGSGLFFGKKWDGTRILSTTSSGSKYAKVIRKNMYVGDGDGWNGLSSDSNFPADYETLYFRSVVKFSSNWQWHRALDKLWYWGQANGKGSAFYMGLIRGRIVIQNQANGAGDTGEWRSTTVVSKGEWHTIELIVNAQSAVGVSDGSFKVFLDGEEIPFGTQLGSGGTVGQNNIEWYASSSSTRLFSGLEFLLFWGGAGSTKTVNDYIDLSEFYITGSPASN